MEFFEAETQTSLSRLIPATGSDERRLYQQAIFVVVVVIYIHYLKLGVIMYQ